MSVLLESARRPRWRIRAEGAPYTLRGVLKGRGYRWEAGDSARSGAWCAEVTEETFESEREFLQSEIYHRRDAAIEAKLLTAFERYSVRSWSEGTAIGPGPK
jgi:DNA polymerase-3 subunit epsilon